MDDRSAAPASPDGRASSFPTHIASPDVRCSRKEQAVTLRAGLHRSPARVARQMPRFDDVGQEE
jgi:hypothetical protein